MAFDDGRLHKCLHGRLDLFDGGTQTKTHPAIFERIGRDEGVQSHHSKEPDPGRRISRIIMKHIYF